MFKLVLEKAEEPEIKLPTCVGSWRKQRSSRKTSTFDYTQVFDCVDHNKLWKILKEMVIPDYLTCLLRNLYVGQEATVRTLYGTADWFKIGKGKYCRQEVKGMTEDKMVEWYHRLNGHEFEKTLGVVDGQGGLACCRPWGHKELDTTE